MWADMKKSQTIYFFMGKGGVGKSTLSALHAISLSNTDKKTLLISMDPAHNQADIFEKKLGEKPVSVKDNLSIIEINIDKWIKRYLRNVQNRITESYQYLTAINLDKKFNVLKYSPGLEEYALLLAFEEILKKFKSYDNLIFDMPPTALALRFFALPKLSLVWLESLLGLRKEIIEKREIITKIKLGRKEFERDNILNKLNVLSHQYNSLHERFRNRENVKVNIVMNEDRLSLNESQRINQNLNRLGIHTDRIYLNKVSQKSVTSDLSAIFKDIPTISYSQADYPLIGIDALNKYLSEND